MKGWELEGWKTAQMRTLSAISVTKIRRNSLSVGNVFPPFSRQTTQRSYPVIQDLCVAYSSLFIGGEGEWQVVVSLGEMWQLLIQTGTRKTTQLPLSTQCNKRTPCLQQTLHLRPNKHCNPAGKTPLCTLMGADLSPPGCFSFPWYPIDLGSTPEFLSFCLIFCGYIWRCWGARLS